VFTGIVEELGEVVGLEPNGDSARLVVRGPKVTGDAARGDSIAINGVCLTVTSTDDGEFAADVIGETLKHSTLGSLAPGAAVNLERPVRPGMSRALPLSNAPGRHLATNQMPNRRYA